MNYTKKYAEVFNFHKQHYPPDKTDEYWERTTWLEKVYRWTAWTNSL